MMRQLWTGLRMTLVLTVLTGLLYPARGHRPAPGCLFPARPTAACFEAAGAWSARR